MQGLFPFSVVTTPYAPLLCTHNNRGRSANSQCVLSAFSCAFVHNWRLGRGPAPSPSGVRARHGMWFATGANYKAKGVAQISAASVVRAAKAVLRDTFRFVCTRAQKAATTVGPPASPSSARSTTRRSPSSCPRAVRLQVPHWHPPSVTLMGLCSRAEPMRPPFRVAYAAARSCSPSMPTAAAVAPNRDQPI